MSVGNVSNPKLLTSIFGCNVSTHEIFGASTGGCSKGYSHMGYSSWEDRIEIAKLEKNWIEIDKLEEIVLVKRCKDYYNQKHYV